MPALKDPREMVHAQRRIEVWDVAVAAPIAAELVTSLLAKWPDVDLPTIHITLEGAGEHDRFVRVTGRRGTISDPECPSCHTHGQHPHTEYCQLVDHASQLTFAELYGPMP